jgi:lactobin A/cerein 7B family class IIb bacteriocin
MNNEITELSFEEVILVDGGLLPLIVAACAVGMLLLACYETGKSDGRCH